MLWLKALHLIGMVAWFAGLFYLPRLFVYHAMSDDPISHERFKIMERKLFFGIMTPAMIFTFVFGIWLLIAGDWAIYGQSGWLHTKLALLAGLLIYHYYCWVWLIKFRDNKNSKTHIYYRWINEIPVFFLVGIIILAVVKPF
jgi:putative membrane protein